MQYILGKNYKLVLDASGAKAEAIYKKCNLPSNASKDLTVSRETFIEFMKEIDTCVDYVTIAKLCDVNAMFTFNPAVYASLCAKNGLECLKRLSTYKKVIGPFAIELIETDEQLTLNFTFDDGSDVPKFLQVTESAIVLTLLQTGTGLPIMPTAIECKTPYEDELTQFFGLNSIDNTKNSISFSKEDVLKPFITENNIMWEFLEPELKRRALLLKSESSISAQIKNILHELIPANKATIDNVAFELALSTRTLQRKLQEENTSFITVLNETKETLAKSLLLKEELAITQVSYLLGYADPSSFMRAFNQWTGMTVNEFRKKY